MKEQAVYLLTMYDCIQRIKEYTAGLPLAAFLEDQKTQDAVIRNIEVIGQAAKDFGIEDLAQDRPDVPWKQIAGMRNIIAHEYFGIDMTITWQVVEEHLPTLETAIADVAKRMGVVIPVSG